MSDRAKLDLLVRPQDGVWAVARRYGYPRIHRFRGYYAQYHGEMPEETLGKAQPHVAELNGK